MVKKGEELFATDKKDYWSQDLGTQKLIIMKRLLVTMPENTENNDNDTMKDPNSIYDVPIES